MERHHDGTFSHVAPVLAPLLALRPGDMSAWFRTPRRSGITCDPDPASYVPQRGLTGPHLTIPWREFLDR
jgi:hypothetical protein